MFEIISIVCIVTALLLLLALSIIDLKILILPDELNFALGVTGLVFHAVTANQLAGYDDMFYGALCGAGMLYVIRLLANTHYGRDTLGLGDVKLMGAAGIWLGLEGILPAITLGAFAGLIHGLAYAGWIALKHKKTFSIHELSIPAGPGFAIGIVLSGGYFFGPYILEVLHGFFA